MNNNSTQSNNNRRGQLAKPDRAFERVPTRPGYDVLYTRYTKETTQPAAPSEPTVVVEEVVTVQQTDIAERMALLLAEAEAGTVPTPAVVTPIVVEEVPAVEVIAAEETQPVQANVPVETVEPQSVEDNHDVVEESSTSDEESISEEAPKQEVVIITAVPELSEDQKANAITRALIKARKDLEKEHRKKTTLKRFSLGLVGLVLLLSTGYIGIDTFLTNNRAKAETSAGIDYTSPNVNHNQSEEGKDQTPLPVNSLKNYQVAPNLPRALYIDKIGIAARLLHMNINSDGSIQAPRNIFDAGWYTSSVKPGENGAVFVDGHSSGSTHQGLFGNLDKLQVGDTMQIEKGDTTRLTYQVVFKETVKLANVDMQKALRVYGGGQKGLNLMTCAGQWTNDNTTMNERVIVYTVQI